LHTASQPHDPNPEKTQLPPGAHRVPSCENRAMEIYRSSTLSKCTQTPWQDHQKFLLNRGGCYFLKAFFYMFKAIRSMFCSKKRGAFKLLGAMARQPDCKIGGPRHQVNGLEGKIETSERQDRGKRTRIPFVHPFPEKAIGVRQALRPLQLIDPLGRSSGIEVKPNAITDLVGNKVQGGHAARFLRSVKTDSHDWAAEPADGFYAPVGDKHVLHPTSLCSPCGP